MKLITLVAALLFLVAPFGFHVADAARRFQTDTKFEVDSNSYLKLVRDVHGNQSTSQPAFEVAAAWAWATETACKQFIVGVKVARAIEVCADKGVQAACVKRICVISKCCKIGQVIIKGEHEIEEALAEALEAEEDTAVRIEAENYLDADSFSPDGASALTEEMLDQLNMIKAAVQKDDELEFKAGWEGLLQLGANVSQVHADTTHQLEVRRTKSRMIDIASIWLGFQVAEYWCKGGKVVVKAAEIMEDCWKRQYDKCFLRLCALGNCCNLMKQSYKLFREAEELLQRLSPNTTTQIKGFLQNFGNPTNQTAEEFLQTVDEKGFDVKKIREIIVTGDNIEEEATSVDTLPPDAVEKLL